MGTKSKREPLVLTEKEEKKLKKISKRISKNKLDVKKKKIADILLYYSYGFTVAEVAVKAGVSEPTAYRYIDEALEEKKESIKIGTPGEFIPIQTGGVPIHDAVCSLNNVRPNNIDMVEDLIRQQQSELRKQRRLKKLWFCIALAIAVCSAITHFMY
jgi:hypothetical protein